MLGNASMEPPGCADAIFRTSTAAGGTSRLVSRRLGDRSLADACPDAPILASGPLVRTSEENMAKRRVIVEIEGTVQWAAHQDEASGMWVGTCRELNLTAVGETWAELQEAGNQATGLLFAELHAS